MADKLLHRLMEFILHVRRINRPQKQVLLFATYKIDQSDPSQQKHYHWCKECATLEACHRLTAMLLSPPSSFLFLTLLNPGCTTVLQPLAMNALNNRYALAQRWDLSGLVASRKLKLFQLLSEFFKSLWFISSQPKSPKQSLKWNEKNNIE